MSNNDTGLVQENLIGRQLSWRVLVLSIIAILALAFATVQSFVQITGNLVRGLEATGDGVADVFDAFLGRVVDDLWITADVLEAQVDVDTLLRHALARRDRGIFELLWLEPGGQVIASRRRVGRSPSEYLAEQPWLETVQEGQVYIGVIDYAEYAIPFIDIAVPTEDEQGAFSGTLVARVDLTVLWDEVVTSHTGETGLVYIIDQEQRLLFHRDVKLVEAGRKTDFDIVRLREVAIPWASDFEGNMTFATFSSMEVAPWYVVSEQAAREALWPFVQQVFFPLMLLAGVVFVVVSTVNFTQREIVTPLRVLYDGVSTLGHGDLAYRIDVEVQGEFALLAETVNSLASQLYETINTLERRVDERTRGLLAAAEVSRSTISVLDPDVLLRQTVELVRERFALYYVGLFLLDADEEYAVLRAGTGEAGAQMLAAAHRLSVGGDTMIGQCVLSGRARIALDVGDEAASEAGGQRFDNPLLPDTRSEMALPLRSHRRVIGAMTVQSDKAGAFDETSIVVMQTMADQVAVAIDNARLYAQTQATLREMSLIQQRYLGGAWREFFQYKPLHGYQKTGAEMIALDATPLPGVMQALEQRDTVVLHEDAGGDRAQVVVPIRFRDHNLGALGFSLSESQPLSDEQIAFVEAIAEQFGQAAENLRLVDATQRLAAREHIVGEIAARMRQSLDIDMVLKTAAEELRQALHTPEVTIRLKMPEVTNEA